MRRARRTTPPLPLGRSGEALVRGFEKLGWHWWPSDNAIISRDRRTPRLRPPRTLQLRLPAQGEGVGRRRLLAESDSSRRAADDVGAGEGNHGRRRRARHRGAVLRSPRQPAAPARACGRRLLQRHRHAETAARFEVEALSRRPGEFDRQRREALHEPPSRYVEGIFDEPFETESFTGNPFFSQQFYETDRGRGFVEATR